VGVPASLARSSIVALVLVFFAVGGEAAASPEILRVEGGQLRRCGAPFRMKGSNIEGDRHTSNTIWRDYWGRRDQLAGSLDQGRAMGSNTMRLIFPDGAVDLDGAGGVRSHELDKLEDMLGLLDARGMGAIVTVFNRHDYANADRGRDAAKVASFLARFGSDRRVLLWDIVNEPQPMGDPAVRGRVLQWLGAMRDAFDRFGHAQPITIGAIGHYDVVIGEGHRTIIDLSDVVSVHCYGRSHPTATPGFLDGVNYQEGYCRASMQYIRNRTGKPVLLEEFGWPDRESRAWPPPHPWRLFETPRTPSGQDLVYAEILSHVDRVGGAGAIQWALEDTPDDGFGLLDRAGQPKRPGSGGAYDRFRGWGGPDVRPAGGCPSDRPPADPRPDGSTALLFQDTSAVRVFRGEFPSGEWDFCHGKADCANGEAVNGLSLDLGTGQGRRALCRRHDGRFGGGARAVLSTDARRDQRRAQRVADWDSGYFKLECGANEYVAGVSENALPCGGNNAFHAVLCAAATGLPNFGLGTACRNRYLAGRDDRPLSQTDDWDEGAFKAECGVDEYAAGVSVHPGTGAPHAILCCRR
jgi:hypothetical protein